MGSAAARLRILLRATVMSAAACAGGAEKHQSPGDPGELREQVAAVARRQPDAELLALQGTE